MRTWLKTDLAYAAALIDGEGTVGVYSFTRKGRGLQFSTRLAVINTHRGIIEWMKDSFGGNIVEKTKTAENSKQCWEWQVHGEEADRLARFIKPYVKMKREQLEIFSKMRERQKERASHRPRKRLHDWEVEERMGWITRMRFLNRQGVS